ncbi:hypothetical protein [Lichenifustis flavocetrariae]|uniref:Uncharacterized protein n=1 Tax=Lichenifustis flavocetrariae TaxID=2949735 RepID=A0AA41YV51_9HYPH|nr:hypothetical protein [Lichenifustis flavocetrariae]MCW6507781.1 hypothetical protein [Lichenifustis flavocetrariae]
MMAGRTGTFPDAFGEAVWRNAVDRVLKGVAFDTVMTAVTSDGILIEPLYPKVGAMVPQPWRRAGRVGVVQRVDHPDSAAANALALADIEGGERAGDRAGGVCGPQRIRGPN